MLNWSRVVVAQTDPPGRNASDRLYCPARQFGFFADPTNCTRYAFCTNGRPTSFHHCLPGRHWRVTTVGFGYCDLPESAGCEAELTRMLDPIGPAEPVKTVA